MKIYYECIKITNKVTHFAHITCLHRSQVGMVMDASTSQFLTIHIQTFELEN